MAPESVVCSTCEAPSEEDETPKTIEDSDEEDDALLSCCDLPSKDCSDSLDAAKPSRIVDLFDSASECVYGLFFGGYRSLFMDSYQFEDFVFYSLWMLCLHFCINEKVPNDTRHYT
ncbi:uncharacterized protein LOC144159577 [Haemaphysalis longicornis]